MIKKANKEILANLKKNRLLLLLKDKTLDEEKESDCSSDSCVEYRERHNHNGDPLYESDDHSLKSSVSNEESISSNSDVSLDSEKEDNNIINSIYNRNYDRDIDSDDQIDKK